MTKRGRKPGTIKKPENVRSFPLRVNCQPAEGAALVKFAYDNGLTVSDLIRQALKHEVARLATAARLATSAN